MPKFYLIKEGITINRDIGDILDRASIAKLKGERIGDEENKRECKAFEVEIKVLKEKYTNLPIDMFFEEMYKINAFIWCLESDLKSGKENLSNHLYLDDQRNINTLAIIGKNSILIRNINSLRVGLKNIINKLLNEGFQDVKRDHISE